MHKGWKFDKVQTNLGQRYKQNILYQKASVPQVAKVHRKFL